MSSYKLKNNAILQDDCVLDRWYQNLKRKTSDFNNSLLNIPPKSMFKQKEDQERIELIEKKSHEIIEIYKEIFQKFNNSLTPEEKKRVYYL